MKILCIADMSPVSSRNGAASRILGLIGELESSGHEVHILLVSHPAAFIGDPGPTETRFAGRFHRFESRALNVYWRHLSRRLRTQWTATARYDHGVDDVFDNRLIEYLRRLQKSERFDAVCVHYVYLSKAFLAFENEVLKILDTLDRLAQRHQQFINTGTKYHWHSLSLAEEQKGVQRADVVIAIQEQEREYFASLTDKPVVTVGHLVPLRTSRGQQVAKRILIVSSLNLPNKHSVQRFAVAVWPRIKYRHPDAELHIAGPICKAIPTSVGATLHGEVPDLSPLYEEAALVVNPTQVGTGLKIRSVEALSHGKAFVSTSNGILGLEAGSGIAFHVADDDEAFTNSCSDLLDNRELRLGLERCALDFARVFDLKNRQTLQAVFA